MELSLDDVAALSTWIYLVIVAVAAGDAVLPILPGESVVILAAVLAAQGELNPFIIAACAATGAALGDSTSYLIGRTARHRREPDPAGRFGRGMQWARGVLRQRGTSVLVAARFVPGGRTATTFTSGYVGVPVRAFLAAISLGAMLWAIHGTAIGYIGGSVFSENVWLGTGLGLALGIGVSTSIELVRARRARAAATPPSS